MATRSRPFAVCAGVCVPAIVCVSAAVYGKLPAVPDHVSAVEKGRDLSCGGVLLWRVVWIRKCKLCFMVYSSSEGGTLA